MIFDLDPEGQTFGMIRKAALRIKKLLEDLDVVPFVMTTGSRGLHVVVPLDRSANFKQVKSCAQDIAKKIIELYPADFTIEVRKNKRESKIFIDTLRNEFAQTAVSPYAVRAKPKAPIATLLDWDEVNDSKLTSQKYNIKNIFKRISRISNPWHDMEKYAVSIKEINKKLAIPE